MKKKWILFFLPILALASCQSPELTTPASSFSSEEERISLPSENNRLLLLNQETDKSLLQYKKDEVLILPILRRTTKEFLFSYREIDRYDDGFLELLPNGFFGNFPTDGSGNNQLPGLKNIVVDFLSPTNESLSLRYGSSSPSESEIVSLQSGVSFDFFDQDPAYFCLSNLGTHSFYIKAITLRFYR